MSEEFIKDNNYTITVLTILLSEKENGVNRLSNIRKTFNFLSAQVTTVTRDWLYEGRGSSAGGEAAVATQLFVQNFNDIQSYGEIKLMHAKLIELGGAPPALADILPILDKSSSPLTRRS